MSCQSAVQIEANADAIGKAWGDTLTTSGMPFDWLICPPHSVHEILSSDTFFPSRQDQMVLSPHPCWKERDICFWHEFRSRRWSLPRLMGRRFDIRSNYKTAVEKYSYLANKFRTLAQLDRLVFVICNTQNNLPFVQERTAIDYVLSAEAIERLCDTCDRYFHRSCEYLFVTYQDRVKGNPSRDNLTVFKLVPDESEWTGDSTQWRNLFAEYFQKSV
jgi:hypothetical protein